MEGLVETIGWCIIWIIILTPFAWFLWGCSKPNSVKTFTDPVTIKLEIPIVEDKPEFSPPVYELEQWIRDNWKKIKVTELYDNISNTHTLWKVESDIVNCEVSICPYHMLYSGSTGLGLDGEETTYLVKLYRSLVFERQVRLHKLKEQRSRKQLARKLQQLGYGKGEYESK